MRTNSPVLYFRVPCGHHVQFNIKVMEDVDLVRSYTPVLSTLFPDDKAQESVDGSLHFLIKTYENGAATQYLSKLEKGSSVLLSDDMGSFDSNWVKSNVQQLLLVFAGTGFTPMIKLLKEFCEYDRGPKNNSNITVLAFNKTVKDIIWKEQLDLLERKFGNSERLSVNIHHILSQEGSENQAKFHFGRISVALLKNILPANLQKRQDSNAAVGQIRLCCICGPIPFNQEARRIFQNEFNYDCEELYFFEG